MSSTVRVTVFIAVALLVLVLAAGYVMWEINRSSARAAAPPEVAVTKVAAVEQAPRVVFRNTEVGSKYGVVSMVSLKNPNGPRAFTDVACDRVYAADGIATCLRTKRGIVTRFEGIQLNSDWDAVKQWPLPGIPSRTRISPDGSLVATTSFVTGHSYMQMGFSTATEIRSSSDGRDFGNLEKFSLIMNGAKIDPVDRNVWGVTFGPDDNRFYATVATGGNAYLVRGDLAARTLTVLLKGVECPSLSPDGKKVAFKHDVGTSSAHWQLVVLDLASGKKTTLAGEPRSVDDQVEWLDDSLLYGMTRADEPGVSDIWRIDIAQSAKPSVFIEQAWSPAVVRSAAW